MIDVLIIGGGVTGCSVAYYLSRYPLKCVLVDKESDVCEGTSKANSAIVHAGFDAHSNTLMARYNVLGSEMMEELCKDLDVPYKRNGSLVVCLNKEDLPKLNDLYQRGIDNGVKGLEVIDRDKLVSMEPNISDDAVGALYAPTGAIVDPFVLTVGLAEVSNLNGIEYQFDKEVSGIEHNGDHYDVAFTDGSTIETKAVINCAGVYADIFHNMVCEEKIHITPRRGDYVLLDKRTGGFVSHTIFQLPGPKGKGVLVTPTVHGNTLVGPTAVDLEDREGMNTTMDGINSVLEKSQMSVKNIPLRQVITSFAGLRAHEDNHEFVLGENAEYFFDCAGIESPGLTSAPAIGKYTAELVAEKFGVGYKPTFETKRKGILDPSALSEAEYNALIKNDPAYGHMICRCESVTEGEIIDAIRRPLGATTVDGVKRRVRSGMGRCQGGFCLPKVMEILARELDMP